MSSTSRTRMLLFVTVLFALCGGPVFFSSALFWPSTAPAEETTLAGKNSPLAAVTLADLVAGKVRVVDMTWTLDETAPSWPAEAAPKFQLTTYSTLEKNGVLSKAISMPEHFGTHLDAPNHFSARPIAVDQLTPDQLIGPGVVLDLTLKAEADPDAMLTEEDLAKWEQQHGPIPAGAIVFLKTGWARHWTQPVRYRNQDARGQMHFPGYSEAATRWLIEHRKIRGIGIDTLSIDPGASRDFPVHRLLNGAGRYGLENVAALDQLPARDFAVIVSPLKLKNGSGGPTRLYALLAK